MPKCPTCASVKSPMTRDTFEDTYWCHDCYTFWYPDEVGQSDDPQAGYLQLPSGQVEQD
jgi:hypothetical protein